jgi:hypothetical protein
MPTPAVEHIGFDVEATTNAKDGSTWANPPLKPCPPVFQQWLAPRETPKLRMAKLECLWP